MMMVEGEGEGEGLGACYSAAYMSGLKTKVTINL